jgi:hypothetical protein
MPPDFLVREDISPFGVLVFVDPSARPEAAMPKETPSASSALGYEILATNVRPEFDPRRPRRRILVIIEVRYRASHLLDAWRSLSSRSSASRGRREAAASSGPTRRRHALRRVSPADGAPAHRGHSAAGPYRA